MSSHSETESLEITGLPLGTTHALEELARNHGQTAEEYARAILEAKILTQKPFREILASVRKGFQESDVTDDELAVLVEKAPRISTEKGHPKTNESTCSAAGSRS